MTPTPSNIDSLSPSIEPATFSVSMSVPLAERFARLAERWRQDVRFVSSLDEIATHPAYQQIIGMGREALPVIFDELSKQNEHWFWALSAITGEDPVPASSRGNMAGMREHWLAWAKQHGYVVNG